MKKFRLLRARLGLASFATALMLSHVSAEAAAPASAPTAAETTAGASEQTVILIRHGEKPAAGLGQLNCQGLNRALALPAVLLAKFGKPDFLFAPDPAQQNTDQGQKYNYIRPLATLEPSAIQFGMPLATPFGFMDIDKLRQLLDLPVYRNAHIVVAWEHTMAERLARALVQSYGGNPADVPRWNGDDFDSIYIVKIDRSAAKISSTFTLDHEGLDHQASVCPGPAPLTGN